MAAQAQIAPIKILRRRQLEVRIGLSRSTIYSKFRPNPKRPGDYDATFPLPVPIGKKAVGWVEAEVDAWLTAQVEKSRPRDPEPKPRKTRPLPVPRSNAGAR